MEPLLPAETRKLRVDTVNYETFDMGVLPDEDTKKILAHLQKQPLTAQELAQAIYNSPYRTGSISPKLQRLKKLGIVANVKDTRTVCYWGLTKKYRGK